jgi:ribosome-binding ATPase YchF (GTP1/OBG family)
MEAGIVGLPNVGKSTLFNALTKAGALAANYPFATIEPNVGVVPIPDRSPRESSASTSRSQKIIPRCCASWTSPASSRAPARARGWATSSSRHIREVDAILQVVRCFTKAPGGEEITHVEGTVDPLRDIEIINTELMLADLETVSGSVGKAERAAKSGEKENIARFHLLKKLEPVLNAGKPARSLKVDDPEETRVMKSLKRWGSSRPRRCSTC